ncbi:MAG: hypothetical protein ACTSRU_03675 [Candidatus Hodarchaeales archaeon]
MALKREQDAKKRIKALENEKRLLKGIYYYYEHPQASYGEIEDNCGYHITDLKKAMRENDFPHRAYGHHAKKVFERINSRIEEIDREIPRIREKIMGSLDQLMIIPSWTGLMGTTFKGFYRNQPVETIYNDLVIMLTHVAVPTFEATTGEPAFIITGAGLYWTKFAVTKGTIVTDFREINTIIMPLETWMMVQESESVVNSDILTMKTHLIDIPFSIIMSPETTQMYLRGVLARNVFHPFREAIDQLVKSTKDDSSWNEKNGLRVLSGGLSSKSSIQLFTNEILIEDEKRDTGYMQMIPGIKNIQAKLSKIEADIQMDVYRKDLFERIPHIKSDFRDVGHRLLTDWMPDS